MVGQIEQESRSPFLRLPAEIREQIYSLILNPSANRLYKPNEYTDYDYRNAFVLFKLNQQIYLEARKVFRDLNVFVRLQTPWEKAEEHISIEGHVPVLLRHRRAQKFEQHRLNAAIDAPEAPIQAEAWKYVVILLDDLDKFTKTWFYADLSYPGLNRFLRLTLTLRDPFTPDWDEKRIPKWLQRQLVLPFDKVKNLHEVVVEGDPKPLPSVETELREAMAVPHLTAESCLREATRFKNEGNDALAKERYTEALKSYTSAWEAMHIVIKGRQRHIHADAFFGHELREAPFKGKNGQEQRLILRVQLVANTTLVYLKLKDWQEACFWGMRTIDMLRGAMRPDQVFNMLPEEEAYLGFPAADQMGKIYYRTAVAYKELGDKDQARRLLRVASVYLPRDEVVRKELAACTLRMG